MIVGIIVGTALDHSFVLVHNLAVINAGIRAILARQGKVDRIGEVADVFNISSIFFHY